jgi:hypothetical protein
MIIFGSFPMICPKFLFQKYAYKNNYSIKHGGSNDPPAAPSPTPQ